jgi:ABC-type uncharacterized transport system involved in gliding motility auxiliary subunit
MKPEIQKERIDSLTTFLIVAGIIIVLNIISSGLSLKLDLTNERVYSIAPVSKAIVGKLSGPMTVKVFFTPGLPAPYNSIERYLKDMMKEYKQASSHNNFRYEFVDMAKNPDEAMEYGIYPVQIRVVEKDQIQMKKAYIGMVFLHADMVERIPQIKYTEGLEYNITSIIRKMINKIDWLSSLKTKIKIELIASSGIPPMMAAGTNGYSEITISPDLVSRISNSFNSLNSKMMGKLEFQYLNPDRDKNCLAFAVSNNFHPIAWKAGADEKGSKFPGGSGYIGMVIDYNGNSRQLNLLSVDVMGNPYIMNIDNLEEAMQGAVDDLIRVNPKVGYIMGDMEPEPWDYSRMGGQENPESAARLADFINHDYEFVPVSLKEGKMPDGLTALVILEPEAPMTPFEQYQIDQFIMSGKPVAFFTPGLFFPPSNPQMQRDLPKGYKSRSDIDKLVENYGIKIDDNLILDDASHYKPILENGEQIDVEYAPLIEQENISQSHVITRKIKGLIFVSSSSLEPIESTIKSNKLAFTPLIKTSKKSWEQGEGVTLGYTFLVPAPDTRFSQYTLAATLEGHFNSYFTGKEIPAGPVTTNKIKNGNGEVMTGDKSPFIASTDRGRILVVPDGDIMKNTILDDEGMSPNDIFAKKIIDWLVGDSVLIQIRNKGLTYNPLKTIPDEVKEFIRISNLIAAPLIIIIFGLILWRMDLRRRESIKKEFQK